MHKIRYTYVFPKHKSQSSNVPSLTIWKMMTKQTADYMIYQVMKKKGEMQPLQYDNNIYYLKR